MMIFKSLKMDIQKARELLKEEGYFVDNLWHVKDVTDKYECSDQLAYRIIEKALTNPYTIELINFMIENHAKDESLEIKNI